MRVIDHVIVMAMPNDTDTNSSGWMHCGATHDVVVTA
jgi:hypothetical protein